MNLRDDYSKSITENNREGSNKAPSYIRALELLDDILKKTALFGAHDFWSINSVETIGQLYEYALENQKLEESEFLQPELPPSYGRRGYYSAALKSYREFLILRQYEAGLWELYNDQNANPFELGKQLARKQIKAVETLVPDHDIDFSSKEGKEVLRQTKARVNQNFFRKMVLADYGARCCVSGLNVPEVLRASHIVGWAESKENRMNPANGLCLSATYDAAFDRHLISFDEKLRMILSPTLKEFYSNDAFKTQFLAFEGRRITSPKRFNPDPAFMSQHREKLCA